MRFGSLVLFAGTALFQFATATPWLPEIRGCAPTLSSNGTTYTLARTTRQEVAVSYVRCEYEQFGAPGDVILYCFYNYATNDLTHYPNTPIPTDSNPNCPTTLPLAGKYLIKSSNNEDPGAMQCVTKTGTGNGALVQLRSCDGRHDYPNQKWDFVGSIIKQGNLCLDVKDGLNANGVLLQTWACVDGARNQQFSHTGGKVVVQPRHQMAWLANGATRCIDRKDGGNADGTPIQLWDCNVLSPNQNWIVEPVL